MKTKTEEFAELAEPLRAWLRKNYGSDAKALITGESAKVEETVINIPSLFTENQNPIIGVCTSVGRNLVFLTPPETSSRTNNMVVMICFLAQQKKEKYCLNFEDLAGLCDIFGFEKLESLHDVCHKPFLLTRNKMGDWLKVERVFDSKK